MDRNHGTRNLYPVVYASMPEQGYYIVSNVQIGRLFVPTQEEWKYIQQKTNTKISQGKKNEQKKGVIFCLRNAHIT